MKQEVIEIGRRWFIYKQRNKIVMERKGEGNAKTKDRCHSNAQQDDQGNECIPGSQTEPKQCARHYIREEALSVRRY